MNHIKQCMPNILNIITPEQSWKGKIIQNWQIIMGSLTSKVSIEKIQKNTIVLTVIDSCWMQELHNLSELIKIKINQTIQEPRIEIIRFKYATKKIHHIQKNKSSIFLTNTYQPLTKKEQQALETIKDPELSQALVRFLQKCHLLS